MKTLRLTAAQATVRYLSRQMAEDGDRFLSGCWAIFGHGNVAGLGEALYAAGDDFPTWRGHNEQGMAHAAIAYAKASNRRHAMAVTTSIGPGATNLLTAATLAHVNRLPVLFLPGDAFASRAPDPVLQQLENFADGTISANDCFRPVSRYFDRITRPEHLLTALPRAMVTMTDPALCGPVTLAFCQDVQAQAYDWPAHFFVKKVWQQRRPRPDLGQLAVAVSAIKEAQQPLIIAGGGVHYSRACEALQAFAEKHQIPVAETQAGKSAISWQHPLNLGAIGVTGASSANAVAVAADLIIGVGTRLQDFTTGSRTLFNNPGCRLLSLNISSCDSTRHHAIPLVADAMAGLQELSAGLGEHRFTVPDPALKASWLAVVSKRTAASKGDILASDAQVIGAVQRAADHRTIVVSAAGGLPGELHKLWHAGAPNGYHVEYGYSCMGYEIAGGLGVKMACPERDVVVMVGDGSYMMMNSELATAVMLGQKITVVVLDNHGFGCIHRLQIGSGNASFNNLLGTGHPREPGGIDFVAHAAAMGAVAEKVDSTVELEEALQRARAATSTYVIVIETDPMVSTTEGGHWWNVAVAEVSERPQVNTARKNYERELRKQRN